MKKVTTLFLSGFVAAGLLLGDVSESGAAVYQTYVKTKKTTYLMDPYLWVYEASKDMSSVQRPWPVEGYPRTVEFTVDVYDQAGRQASQKAVDFEVLDDNFSGLKDGSVQEIEPGRYQGTFELTEADLGGASFSGQETKTLSLELFIDGGNSAAHVQPISVGRWGCDRCHMQRNVAKQIYSWSDPAGDATRGPHSWANILGRRFRASGFNLSFLTNSENTHTPENNLNVFPFHEKTKRKFGGDRRCAPCHQGSGTVRYPYTNPGENVILARAKSEAVECTFCHGINGGYVPADNSWWEDNGQFIMANHRHNNVSSPPDRNLDPYLAQQSCSNIGCHGHIDDNAPGEIQNAVPDCRRCHGIHNDTFVQP